jgi:hypothetical protein
LPLFGQEASKPTQERAANQEKKAEEAKPEEKPADQAAPAAAAGPTSDRVMTGSVDVGYRWVSQAGNPAAYRTVVNLGEGPKLLNFDFNLTSPNGKWYDKITAFGNNWGGDPNSVLRLDMTKQRLYDFTVDYRDIAYYNFLPSFANPNVNPGVFSPQKGYDIHRHMFDTELRFRPGARIIPYFAYNRNWGDGTGVTNFVTSGNEYPVFNSLFDKTDQYRGGVIMQWNKFHVTLEGGGTQFADNQQASTRDRNPGNRTTPYLGQTLYLQDLTQTYGITGNSVFERAIVTATPWSWIDLSGQFLYSQPKADTTYDQTGTGNFVNMTTLLFSNTNHEFVAANASQPHSSGVANIEIRPFRRVRILEAYMTDRFHTASAAAWSDLTVNAQAVPVNSADRLEVNYNRQQVQANVEVTKWLTIRGGHRYVWGDALVRAPKFIPGPSQSAELSQQVGLFGLQLRMSQKLWVSGDAEIASADKVYFRTSLADYRKGTVRARYQATNSFQFTGNFVALTNENPNPAIKFDMASYMVSTGFLWNPKGGKIATVLGDYTYSNLHTSLGYFQPQSLTPATSLYNEHAHIGTTMIDLNAPFGGKRAAKLSAGGSFYTSGGSRPTSYYTPIVRLSAPVYEHAALFAEWRNYQMAETIYSYEGFRAHTFVVGLRLIR